MTTENSPIVTPFSILLLVLIIVACEKDQTPDEVASIPETVVLNAPDDEATSVHHYPHFQWSAIGNADSYELQVSTNGGFNTSYELETVSTNEYRDSSKFYSNDQYFWRVRAENSAGQGNWSDVFTFIVDEGSNGNPNTGPEYGDVLIFDSGLVDGEEKEVWVSGDSFGTYAVKTFTCSGSEQSNCDFEGEDCGYLSTSVYAYGIEFDFEVRVYQGGSLIDIGSITSPQANGCVIVDLESL